MLAQMRVRVLEANLELVRRGLVLYTFGNASAISRADGLVVIKPSGVGYNQMSADDMVIVDLQGDVVEGELRPSVDLATHLALYHAFPTIGGVVHTHSEFATSWAQAGRAIPCFGTTHADYFHGEVPLAESLTEAEVREAYVRNTGAVIVRLFHERNLDPLAVPGVLVSGHAPFAWGKTAAAAVEHADLLEYIARLAYRTVALDGPKAGLARHIAEHHYQRKHGPKATYGQKTPAGS